MCQLSNVLNPGAEFCIPEDKFVIYLKYATLAVSLALLTAWELQYEYFLKDATLWTELTWYVSK